MKEKILKLHEEYRSVQKRKGKSSNAQKEQIFIESLDGYFFIAHQEAVHKIKNDRLLNHEQVTEDLTFLGRLERNTEAKLGKKMSNIGVS